MQIGDRIKVINNPPVDKKGKYCQWVDKMIDICGKEFLVKSMQIGFVSIIDNDTGNVWALESAWYTLASIPVEIIEKCTCDIMALMARGCKCGFIEKERCRN